jgi:hypothetical protein
MWSGGRIEATEFNGHLTTADSFGDASMKRGKSGSVSATEINRFVLR